MGFIVGDILAQRLTGEAFDAVRSLELGLYGTLLGMLLPTALRHRSCFSSPQPLPALFRALADLSACPS